MNKRTAILESLAAFILDEGLEAATLRALAKAAGQSDRMLLYYFKDKDEMVSQTLDLVAARFSQYLEAVKNSETQRKDVLHAALDHVVLSDDIWPFLRLWLDLAGRAARGDPLFGPLGQKMGRDFHQWITDQLATTNPDLRRQDATEIMIGLKGVVLLKSIGMEDLTRELL